MKHATPRAYGNISLLVVFATMTTWSAFTTIDQTVLAHGQFLPTARNQVVQVVDGGVLQAIHVKEGQGVKRGQPLATLEPVRADAALQELRGQLHNVLAAKRRADAFANGFQTAFSRAEIQQNSGYQVQQALFEQQLAALQADLSAFDKAIELANAEIRITEKLFAAGDVSQTDVMRVQRSLIELNQRRQSMLDAQRTEARRESGRLQLEVDALRSRLQERDNVLGHTTLTAPVDGDIQLLRSHTLGAVLRSGEELLHVSPSDSPLMVEARIYPVDMADIKRGLPVRIRIDAWDFAVYGALEGEIAHISPDVVSEPAPNGQAISFYRVHIALSVKQNNHKLEISSIRPGMTAQLDIRTGERSVLSYLLGPIKRGMASALREK
jgi:adhesin transport system membrane fusion protein